MFLSHSGFFHLKLCTKKEGIARKKNLISHTFGCFFVCNLVHDYKFHGYKKTKPPSFKDIEKKGGN